MSIDGRQVPYGVYFVNLLAGTSPGDTKDAIHKIDE